MDYRRSNAITQQDAYPLPRIDDSLDALSISKFFSTLDLISGYRQAPLHRKISFCYQVRTLEVEGVVFWLDARTSHFSITYEDGLSWTTLEELAIVP